MESKQLAKFIMINKKRIAIFITLCFLFLAIHPQVQQLIKPTVKNRDSNSPFSLGNKTSQPTQESVTVKPVLPVTNNVCSKIRKETSLTEIAKEVLNDYFKQAKQNHEQVTYQLAWENNHYKNNQNEVFIVSKKTNDLLKIEEVIFVEDKQQYPMTATKEEMKKFYHLFANKELIRIYNDHYYSLKGKDSLAQVGEENGSVKEFAITSNKLKLRCNQLDQSVSCECSVVN